MAIEIREETISALAELGKVSQRLTVWKRFVVVPVANGIAGLALDLEEVDSPYVKDYDRDNGHGPEGWSHQWDVGNWGNFSALDGLKRIGGALIAWDTPGIELLEGRKDRAVLWDIRVREDHQRQGIGTALLSAAVDWARARGCRSLFAETQSINVPACRFYASQRFRLASIDPFAYPDHPEEVRLIWVLRLDQRDGYHRVQTKPLSSRPSKRR